MIDKDLSVITYKEAEEFDVDRMTIGAKTNGSVRKVPLSKRTLSLLIEYTADCEKFLQKHKLTNPDKILFFQRRGIDKIGKVIYAYGSGLRNRVSEYLMGHNKNALDLRYVKDYYSLAKECMPVWEKILDDIIGNKTV